MSEKEIKQDEKDRIIEELSNAIDEANQNYIDLLNKHNALQAEYNKVCYQRDALISVLDKVIK